MDLFNLQLDYKNVTTFDKAVALAEGMMKAAFRYSMFEETNKKALAELVSLLPTSGSQLECLDLALQGTASSNGRGRGRDESRQPCAASCNFSGCYLRYFAVDLRAQCAHSGTHSAASRPHCIVASWKAAGSAVNLPSNGISLNAPNRWPLSDLASRKLFTLTNPHAIPPTKYAVKNSDGRSPWGRPLGEGAVFSHMLCGPGYGGGIDLYFFHCPNRKGIHSVTCGQLKTRNTIGFPSTFDDTTGKGALTFTGVQEDWLVTHLVAFTVTSGTGT